MISLILVGHGHIASGLHAAITQVLGTQADLFAVDFPEGMSTEQLHQALQTTLTRCTSPHVVFFTDLLGGSPFRTAAQLAQAHPGIEVVAGMNLAMFAEILLERDDFGSATACRQRAIEAAHNGIVSLAEQLARTRRHSEASHVDKL